MTHTKRVSPKILVLLECLSANANLEVEAGIRGELTTEGSSRDKGVTKGWHSSGVRAETLRNSPANKKQLLN